MSIRFKVILPYLLLTLIVAVTGAYVVTRLVANSLGERLTNQLLQSGRIVSDSFATLEIQHVQEARTGAYTVGVAEAVINGDRLAARDLVLPAASGFSSGNLFFFNMQDEQVLHIQRQTDGNFLDVTQEGAPSGLAIVQSLLQSADPDSLPRREINTDPGNNRIYYFTAIPILRNNNTEMVGVVVVGTALDAIMPTLKNTSLADVIIYNQEGRALASTFLAQGDTEGIFLATLSISPEMYREVISMDEVVQGENITIGERPYSLARGTLKVSDDRLGVFAVVLPANYVVDSGALNRNIYILIYSIAMVVTVLIGYGISRLIINPLSSLVKTSQAIASGDLSRRTGIRSSDEIGVLANTFDSMTENLEERTLELERTNKILEQMDRTKVSFINISAHELRTPLTIVQGYSQILEQKAGQDPELASIAKGILEGSERMVEVVNSMLDVSRIDSKSLNPKYIDLNLSQLIAKAEKPFKEAIAERDLTFSTDGVEGLPVIPGDPELLNKVFYHLIMNAVKYTPNGGRIDISGQVVGEDTGAPEVEITVRDTGVGIDPQYHELVFEKFFQTGEVMLHSSGKTKFKGGGPGLGLSIAKGIVEAHRGRIWLESPGHDEQRNPGTTFYVRLPLQRPDK